MEFPKRSRLSPPSSSSTQSSAAIVADDDDLLTEILVLLPVKQLVRFKLVSTHWQSLISAESFTRLHLLNHGRGRPETLSFILGVRGRSQLLICHPSDKKLSRFPLPLNFDFRYYENVKIMQSCNGLLLIKTETREGARTSYYVVNPTTVQSRCITTPQFEPIAVCLLFDPSKSPYYRVVAFWKENPDEYMGIIDRFSVYDSATHDWKDGGEFQNGGFTLSDGVSCNDSAYFLSPNNPCCYSPNEKLRIIPRPPRKIGKRYMVESNGHLHCIHLAFHGNMPCFDIAEMIDNKWLTYKVAGMYPIGNTTTNVELLGMMRTERMKDSMFLFHVPGRIMIYRFGERCEVVVDYRSDFFYEEGHFQFEFKDAHPFIATFASV